MLPYAVARGAASKLDRPAALTMATAAPASPNGGPPPGLAAARQRLEELFEHWLGLEETEAKITEWVRKAERGELPAQPAPSLADLTNDRHDDWIFLPSCFVTLRKECKR